MLKNKKTIIGIILFSLFIIGSIVNYVVNAAEIAGYSNDTYDGENYLAVNANANFNELLSGNGQYKDVENILINPLEFVHAQNTDSHGTFCVLYGENARNTAYPYYVCRINDVHPAIIALLNIMGSLDEGLANNGSFKYTKYKPSQVVLWEYISKYQKEVTTKGGNTYKVLPRSVIGSNGKTDRYLFDYVNTNSNLPEVKGFGAAEQNNDSAILNNVRNRIRECVKELTGEDYVGNSLEDYYNKINEYYNKIDSYNLKIETVKLENDGVHVVINSNYNKFLVYTNSATSDETETEYTKFNVNKLGENKYEIVLEPWEIGKNDKYKLQVFIDYETQKWNLAILSSNIRNKDLQNILIAEKTTEKYKGNGDIGEVEKNINISLQKYISRVIPNSDNYALRCDINKSGKIESSDVRIIDNYVHGLINYTKFKAELNKEYGNVEEYISKIGADMDKNGKIDWQDVVLFFCDPDNDGILKQDSGNIVLRMSSNLSSEWLYFNKITKESEFLNVNYAPQRKNRTLRSKGEGYWNDRNS